MRKKFLHHLALQKELIAGLRKNLRKLDSKLILKTKNNKYLSYFCSMNFNIQSFKFIIKINYLALFF